MIGRRWIWLAATSLCLTFGCGDATGPGGRVEVSVSPETVRQSNPDSALMRVIFRNGTAVAVRLPFEIAVVQVETTPGVWQRVAGGNGYYNITGQNVNDIEPNSERLVVDGFVLGYFVPDIRHMPVGRYRVVLKYAPLNASRSEPAPSSYVEAYSNVVTITP